MAIGLALLMGFIFSQNFNSPYRAPASATSGAAGTSACRASCATTSISRSAAAAAPPLTYRNLMITMVLGGLWHGAAWTFVLWGAFHGAMLVTEHALGGRIGRRTPIWLRWFVTFLVVFAWILFRSPDLEVFGTSSGAWSTRGRRRC